jgi:hypothetical protein
MFFKKKEKNMKIRFYYEFDKYINFSIDKNKFDKSLSLKYWKNKFEKDLAKLISNNNKIMKKKDMFYNFKINENIEIMKKILSILEIIYAKTNKQIFYIKKEKFYSFYISEDEYRNIKLEYIFHTFQENLDIIQHKYLNSLIGRCETIVEDNNTKLISRDKKITKKEIKYLEKFDFQHQRLNIKDLKMMIDKKEKLENGKSYSVYENEVFNLFDKINDLKINSKKLEYQNIEIYKLNNYYSYSVDESKHSLFIKLDNFELYYEEDFGNNNLSYVVPLNDDNKYNIENKYINSFSFNINIFSFLTLVLILKDNVLFFDNEKLENFKWPQLQLIDLKTFSNINKHIVLNRIAKGL